MRDANTKILISLSLQNESSKTVKAKNLIITDSALSNRLRKFDKIKLLFFTYNLNYLIRWSFENYGIFIA